MQSVLDNVKDIIVLMHVAHERPHFLTKMGHNCGGEGLDWRSKSCGQYWVFSNENGRYYLQLKEESGKLHKMTLEIKESYLIRINGRELKRHFR